jgi:MOSC domain-containing protein YiiM
MNQLSENALISLSVVGIYTSPHQGQPMVAQKEIVVVAGKGIRGDRYFLDDFDGFYDNSRIANSQRAITLIALEGIEEGNKVLHEMGGTSMKPEETRRNLVVSVSLNLLNALIEQEFDVGSIRMRGVELCGPCVRPPRLLGREQDGPAFVKAFLRVGGIRAIPLTSGIIHEGDPIVLLN